MLDGGIRSLYGIVKFVWICPGFEVNRLSKLENKRIAIETDIEYKKKHFRTGHITRRKQSVPDLRRCT